MEKDKTGPDKSLQERVNEYKRQGKQEHEITYGMLCDGFQSLQGIPDDFYSAEDPADRVRLWEKYQEEQEGTSYCWDRLYND